VYRYTSVSAPSSSSSLAHVPYRDSKLTRVLQVATGCHSSDSRGVTDLLRAPLYWLS
jgi:hypothetical protein